MLPLVCCTVQTQAAVLKIPAQRLLHYVRDEDTVCRNGRDEFLYYRGIVFFRSQCIGRENRRSYSFLTTA
jgi:hypothetical protein